MNARKRKQGRRRKKENAIDKERESGGEGR
jgi:hypothetical protein